MSTTVVVGTLIRLLTGLLHQRSLNEREARVRAEHAERQASRIASVLQRSLLPPSLPEIDGVELGAAYRPGVEGAEVGGDFYDVFELIGGDWGLMIGDVRGKGPEAATVTSLVRHTVRAAAVQSSSPCDVLHMVNDVMLRDCAEEELCTAIYGRLESHGSVTLCLSIGGHPQPVLLRASGEVGRGRRRRARCSASTTSRASATPRSCSSRGDALVMVTDGVQDSRTPDGRLGEKRLIELVGSCGGLSAQEIAACIEEAVAEEPVSGTDDDVAVLVVRGTRRLTAPLRAKRRVAVGRPRTLKDVSAPEIRLSPQAARKQAAREARLAEIAEQVDSGRFVVRQMTPAERKKADAGRSERAAARAAKAKTRTR